MARSHLEWEKGRNELYAEKWLSLHGFSYSRDEVYVSKSIYTVCLGEISDKLENPGDPKVKMKSFMEQFEKRFALKRDLQALKDQQAKE